MKLKEFKQILREEIRNVLNENKALNEGVVESIAKSIEAFTQKNPNGDWNELTKFLDTKFNTHTGQVWDKQYPTYHMEYVLFLDNHINLAIYIHYII